MGRIEEKQGEQSCVSISNWRTKPFKPTFTLSHHQRWSQLALPIIHHSISWFHQLCCKLVLEIITRFTLYPRRDTLYIYLVLFPFEIEYSVSLTFQRCANKSFTISLHLSLKSYLEYLKLLYIYQYWMFKLQIIQFINPRNHNPTLKFQCWGRICRINAR